MHSTCRLLIATLALLCAGTASAIDTDRDDVRAFIDEMVEQHGFERAELVVLLGEAEVQEGILEAMRRPAERTKPWHEYRDIFIQPKRVKAGVAFWAEHADAIERISADTGVPAEILVGIIGVETYYGRITGKHRVLDALVTLGFDYPPRANFFRKELGQFLQLAREEDIDPRTALGSYAGAMGAPQFIPSSYRAYADDGDGDGRKDLFNNWDDVLASVA
ncbi:MAG: lytic murein transglycosylase, partial [Pseudomonadota bacterium]